jgi:hypothetical protein
VRPSISPAAGVYPLIPSFTKSGTHPTSHDTTMGRLAHIASFTARPLLLGGKYEYVRRAIKSWQIQLVDETCKYDVIECMLSAKGA